MDAEDILRKYKLREPSADLKARIAGATRGEWEKRSNRVAVDFQRNMWRLTMSLAASILIAVTGSAVNSVITAPAAFQGAAVSRESVIDMDLGIEIDGQASRWLFARVQQPVDVTGFVKMREARDKELSKGG